MAFESFKKMISSKSAKSVKSAKKDHSNSLFSNIGEFGNGPIMNETVESDETVYTEPAGSNIFGELMKNPSATGDLFTLKKSRAASAADSAAHSAASVNSMINMDSVKDLAKTSTINDTSTKYLRIFGITVLLFLLIGSVLLKSSPTNMEDAKHKFFGMVDFSGWFDDEQPPPPPPPPAKRGKKAKKGPQNITETDEEKSMNEPTVDRHKYKPHVMPDDAASMVQSSKATGKSGWCYIGEDRGFRSCVNVNTNDTCMSGKIFENQEKCIHPELRM
jgi:hypothetical protein